GHAAYQSAHTAFALRCVDLSVEILAGHDVGGRHRPVFGHLDVLLLEDPAALRVSDRGCAQLPLELVVGRGVCLTEMAAELQPRRLLGGQSTLWAGGVYCGRLVSYIGHDVDLLMIHERFQCASACEGGGSSKFDWLVWDWDSNRD